MRRIPGAGLGGVAARVAARKPSASLDDSSSALRTVPAGCLDLRGCNRLVAVRRSSVAADKESLGRREMFLSAAKAAKPARRHFVSADLTICNWRLINEVHLNPDSPQHKEREAVRTAA